LTDLRIKILAILAAVPRRSDVERAWKGFRDRHEVSNSILNSLRRRWAMPIRMALHRANGSVFDHPEVDEPIPEGAYVYFEVAGELESNEYSRSLAGRPHLTTI
jgi:hypothetical protein